MKQNIEEVVNEFVEESFKKEKINYHNIIKDHIKEGYTFEKSYNKIEGDIYQILNNKQFDSDYKDLVYGNVNVSVVAFADTRYLFEICSRDTRSEYA